MKGSLKGTKGLIQAGLLFAAVFSLALMAYYIVGFASVSLSNNTQAHANATFDTNQTGIDLNLTINITQIVGTGIAIRSIDINITQAGFANVTAENLRCPDNTTTWTNSSITAGSNIVLRCANTSTAKTLNGGVVQVRILGLTARNSPGTPTFNVSLVKNETLTENSTLVQVTLLELQASASVNDTTTTIDRQKSYNFTITNNATAGDVDSINEIRIDYTLSGFPDPANANITCPKIPATTGFQWDKALDATNNVIRCSKPAASGTTLGSGSSTNIVVENWHASPIAQTRRFNIIVNGTSGQGTYTVANESSPSVVVNGTINVTGTSRAPATVAVNATNVTIMLFNFTTVGEQFNVSVIKVTLGGTALAGDIDGVRLINDTNRNGVLDSHDNQTFNASALTSARQYEFTGINFVVRDNNTLLLVANISGAATAGRTFSFNINATSDINSLGGSSGANVTEVNGTSLQSVQGTIHGRLQVTGYNQAPATKAINTANIVMAYFELNASGEGMNITVFNVTRTGSATDSDVLLVRLFNDTNNNAVFDSGTDTQFGAALNTSSSGQYVFTGFQFNVTTGTNPHRLILVVNTSSATGGRLFSFGLNNSGDINVIGATTAQNLTDSANLSFGSAQSGTTTIHGTLSVTGKTLNANTTVINTAGIPVLLLNFTASGEQINITQIVLERTGSATDSDIVNVSIYNDTDRSGTFTAEDLVVTNETANALNTTITGGYVFMKLNNGNGYNVTTAGSSLIVLVSSAGTATTGGKTFNLSLNSTSGINAFTASSNQNITGSTNITLTTTNGNVTRIFGTLAIAGSDLTPTTVNNDQLDVPILNITLTATGEQMNITQINVSMNNTNNDDVAAAKLYNDSDRSGSINADDFLVATATKTGSLLVFGSGTSQLFNVSATADKRLILAYDVNSTASGGNLLDANISIAGHVLVTGSSSALSITSSGLPLNPAGESQVAPLQATATIDFTSTKITASDDYNFTIQNTGSEEINSIMIDYTASAFADPTAGNTICPTIAGGAWTKTLTAALNTINCTSPAGANNLAVGSKTNVTVKSFQAPTSAGNKTFVVQVRGTSGGFFNATTNGVTVSGLLNISGANQIASAVAVNSVNLSVIRYNFTASGEQMNITVIKLTRAGTSREADVVNVKLFTDANSDGTYTATTDTTQLGTTQTANNTGGQYEFTGFQFNVTTGTNQSIFAVLQLAATSATGGKTLILNINETVNGTNAIGATTGVNITENLTGTASTASTIFSVLNVSGKNLAAVTAGLNTSGIAILQLNFTTIGGEQINITEINLSRLGSVVDGDIFNVSLYNDTDLTGTFNPASDSIVIFNSTNALNTTSGGLYKFYNISDFKLSTATKTLFVVVSINDTGAGRLFNLSVNATGNIHAYADASDVNLTGTTNITLVNTSSATVTIVGGFTITGKNLAPATKAINTSGLAVLQLNFSAIGEGMNISVIKITRKGSAADGQIYNVTLVNDTDLSGTFNAGDLAMGTAGVNTTSASQYVFTGFQYNITANAAKTLFVVVTTNDTAGNAFNLSLNGTEDINTISGTTNQNVSETILSAESSTTTIHGTITVTGKTIAPTSKAADTANLAVLQLNFSAAGEAMNVSMINFSVVGTATEANLTNMRLMNDTNGNGQFDAGTDTVISTALNTTTGAQLEFGSLTHIINTGGVNTLFVVVNISGVIGSAGKTFNFSINNTADINVVGRSSMINLSGSANVTRTSTQSAVTTTIHGIVNILGKNLALSATTPPTANFSVLLLNFTARGEEANISLINLTRLGGATDGNITNVRLFNDTNLNGTFDLDDRQIFAAQDTSTGGEYVMTGAQFNLSVNNTAKSLILVINITSTATGGAAFNFSVAATNDVQLVTGLTNINMTGTSNITLTTTESSTTTVNSVTITGTDLVSTDPNRRFGTNFYEVPWNEANVPVLRLNLSATGEGMNVTVVKFTRGAQTDLITIATDSHITNLRLFNDTNGDGRFSSADTQIGAAVNTSASNVYEFSGFQYNVSTSGVNTLFLVLNTTSFSWTRDDIGFNLSLAANTDINSVGAVTGSNISETLTNTLINTTRITTRGWYNMTQVLVPGWNNNFFIPQQAVIETTGRNASTTGNFNFTSILSSLGTSWTHMYYNINDTANGWVLATRSDFAGSTLQYVNNTNSNPYFINMSRTERFEL